MGRHKISLMVFLSAWSAMSMEIVFTRLFSAIYFSSFTFFIISTALFGIGLSGVQFALSKKRILPENLLLLLTVSLPLILYAVINIKIDFTGIFDSFSNSIFLLINFLALIIPFFLTGGILIRIFSHYSSGINRIYFFDLAGAAAGAVMAIPFITLLGAVKFLVLISIILLIFQFFTDIKRPLRKYPYTLALSILVLLFFQAGSIYKITPKVKKRDFARDQKLGRIEYSSWSPVNKIDIAPFAFGKNRKVVWLNCGTQQTWLVKENKNSVGKAPVKWTQASIPYQLTRRKGSAFIIGSAGGYEVFCGLSNGFKKIVAVEMDPKLCDLVSNRYSDYIGDLFHRKGVYLINDEGRSFLNRLNKNFDVIQMVNSHPKDTILAGGLSISETYIYTREAFRDYWNHLNKDGFLSIVHIYGERMFSTALSALRDMNIKFPEKKFFIIQAKKGFNYFFMKKGDINQKDIKILTRFAGNRDISFSPELDKKNIYHELAYGDFKSAVKSSSVNISPAVDTSPYFNQPNLIGQFKFRNNFLEGMAKMKVYSVLKYTNYVYLSILLMTIILSFFLIYLPMRISGKKLKKMTILYFFLIGTGYISIEIILIKIFQLALGNPAYSISLILFALLISSGAGSYYFEKILNFFGNKIFYVSLFISSILIIYIFILFPLIYSLFSFPLFLRIVISIILISIPGIPMGVFFPMGIKNIDNRDKKLTGWAWGANGFATVLGSVLTVIISINFNFLFILFIASIIYLLAGYIFPKNTVNSGKSLYH